MDGVVAEPRRPFAGSNLVLPVALLAIACTAVVLYGLAAARAVEQAAAAGARSQGQAIAREIGGFVARERERLAAFVEDKHAVIEEILAFHDNWPAIDALEVSLQRMFEGAISFTVTDEGGSPLFENFDGLVGPVCRAAMRKYAAALQRGGTALPIPPIHPVPGAYHFDLITPWRLDDGSQGLFFVSMAPARIAQMIAVAEQASGMRILLVKRDEPALIEVAADGARDAMRSSFRLPPDALGANHYATDVAGTAWRLLVIPDELALAAAQREVYQRVALIVLALVVISIALLYVIRRFEQRNSSLFLRSLQSSVGRQRAILQTMVDGMVTINSKGEILHVNEAVTRLFGYQPGEMIGENVKMMMTERHRAAHDGYLHNYLTTGESKIIGVGREVVARCKDGREIPVFLTIGESFEGDERIFVGILHDMTAYREAQRKIAAQANAIRRANQELDEISQAARNDLQQPLLRIASLGESLGADEGDRLSGSERAQLRSLTDEARDMSAILKGLADYAGAEQSAGPEVIDLAQVIAEVRRDLAASIERSGAELTVDTLPGVLGDRKQLRQLFWNLIDNALKFRGPGRRPRIQVRAATPAGAEDASRVEIQVADNGIGIPQDQLEAVFGAFYRLHAREAYPGVGLGLSLCRKIVDGMGGRIHASSLEGQSTVIHVVLPRVAADAHGQAGDG